jgi:malate dehydrogenase (oxaloacetate-decarboxylating)
MYGDTHDFTNNSTNDNSIYIHNRCQGMIESYSRININSLRDLDALFSKENLTEVQAILREDPNMADFITLRKNYSAIITNGTAVLGFGHIGGIAGLPVMEGKGVLFKDLGNVNMIPICVEETDPDKVITLVRRYSPIFCSINLEDIKAPDCFKIERTCIELCRPVIFHDDQHGTAIICAAALINSLKLLKLQA